MKPRLIPLLLLTLGLTTHLRAVNFNGSFTENFDSMGTAGTAPPSGWSVSAYAGGSTDWTAATGITGVSGGTVNATLLATTTFTSTSSATQGYNFATSTNTLDRSLGTSPTGNKGTALEVSLTNTTGAGLSSIQVRYDTRRFANGSTANTLVGYWLFYSLDGGTTWTNVSALNPAISGSTGVVVPNNTGTTNVPPTTISLGTAWASGSNLLLRWVDDNASESSPDQIIGLDNVSIATVPADSTKTALLFNGSTIATGSATAGTGSYVTMGSAAALGASSFTIECKIYKTGTGTTASTGTGGVVAVPLVTKGRSESDGGVVDCNYFMGIDSTTGKLCADFEQLSATNNGTAYAAGQNFPILGSTVLANNTWYHLAATYDTATAVWKLYVNGVAETTTLPANTPPSVAAFVGVVPRNDSTQHFGIGTAMNSSGVAIGFFQGVIDEVRVWNKARSSAEVLATKDQEITTAVTGLLGRYGLNEGTGTSISNTVGVAGAPLGTLTSAPVWVDAPAYTANVPPTIAFTAPADGTTVLTGSTVALTATASDSDGSVSKVQFYQGATLIGEDTNAPYAFDWTGFSAGDYSLTAKAIDNSGATTTSTPVVTLHVVANQAPVVAITAPADNTTLTAPATVTITATASDTDGSIAKVEFFNGATKLGGATTAPYSFSWSSIPTGDYAITAKATDDLGTVTTSAAITLHVMPPSTVPPVVAITAPANGANFVAPATINIGADATDPDGTVVKVEFFNGSTKLGEDTTSPFAFSWTGMAIGDYTLTAKATDDMTATTTSTAITVHVLPNQAPVVTVTAPANNATGIGSSTSLNLGIADNEGEAQTVTYYGRNTAPAATAASDFSFIAVPDTQFYSENIGHNASGGSAGATASIYYSQMQWIVDNQATRKIAFVSHMGDIAQNGDANQSEWIVADTAMKKIENPSTTLRAHGIPWGVAPGNHDQQPNGDAGGVTNYFTQYFGFNRWDNRPYYGGHFGTKPAVSGGTPLPANTNNYELFSAGGLDFIVVHMEYDLRAASSYQAVLDWADALLKTYPNRRAIVTSHWIVNTGNPATFSTQGQNIYNALKNNPNLFLMLCGHVNGEGRRSDTFNGHTVYSILQDYQDITNGGNGFMRIYNFSPANNLITVESYSPTLGRAVNAGDSVPQANLAAFTLPYNMQSAVTDWIPLGTVNVPAAGTTANLAWTGLEAGKDYEWYATVNDGVNTVTTATNRFSTTPPAAPTVTITSPANNGSVGLNTTIDLAATASDADGTIARVEFFDGGTKLGEDTTAPYTFAWTGAVAGVHTLTAVATDNSGLDAISSIVTFNVNNTPPTVTLTEPDPEEVFNAPASVYMTADAADSDGTVVKVEYYANGTKVGEATTAPAYEFFWNNVYTGSYNLTAKAIDDGGASTVSASLHIVVENPDNVPPVVAITAPSSGVVYAGTITITASASDTDGSVSKVEFYNGATKLGEDTTAPYSFAWSSVAVGIYTLTAVATDNDSGATTSAAVNLNVQTAPFTLSENFDSIGATGTAFPSGWSIKNANTGTTNATWTDAIPIPGTGTNSVASMVATTGVLTVAATPAVTNVNGFNAQGASSTDRVLATSPTTVAGVAIQWQVTNTGSTAITAARIGYDIRRYTAATTANELPGYWLFYSLDNGTTWTNVSVLNPTLAGAGVQVPNSAGVTTVPPTDFTLSSTWGIGSTMLLRWVDDNAVATSPDQIIGLDNVTLTAAAAVIGTPPTVALTAPLASDSFVAAATVNLAATATDSDGTLTKVEFYNGATKLGEDTTAPYTYAWTGVAAGTYSLTARAIDNDANSATSTAVSITVNPAPGSGTLARGPYLQMAKPTGMTIRWRSSQTVAGRVQYGTSAGSLTTTVNEASATTEHEIALSGLTPNTTYFYSVGSAYDTLIGDATTTFTTPPVVGTAMDTRVWVLGDAGTASSNQTAVRDAFYNWTGTRTPNMVLQLGDNAYNSGLDTEFQAGMFNIYGTMLKKTPFWSCLGNHETAQATAFVDTYPYFNIYTFPKAGECGGLASGTEHYYSWDHGNIHFISLDSMTASRSPTGAMATWLTSDLANTTATWIICIFHHPPYTKGSHNSDSETELIEMRTNILPILEAGGVDLVLSGHSHCYERSYLLDGHYGTSGTITAGMKKNAGDGRPAGSGAYIKPLFGPRNHLGAVYAVTGSAGQISGGTLNHPAHFISLNNLGSLALDVNGTTLNATFVKSDGTAPDTFTVIKQGGTLPPTLSTVAASNVTATSATLNATVSPNGMATTAKFQRGTTNSYGTDSPLTLSPNDGNDTQSVSLTLSGLLPGTTYHFRVTATNTNGTSNGNDLTFTTPKLVQAISFAAITDKTYGAAPFDVSATGGGSTEPVVFSILSGPATISGSTVTITGTGDVTVRASQAGDASYLPAIDVDRSFAVAKATQTISFATIADKTFGDAPFDVVGTGGNSTSPVILSIASGPATISGSTVAITGAGTVTVRASQSGDANYLAASDVDRSFTVAKAPQTISFDALTDKTYGDAPFDVSAAGGGGTAFVIFNVVNGPATLSGSTVTITGVGIVTIRASQSGDANYLAATNVDRSFIVAQTSIVSFATDSIGVNQGSTSVTLNLLRTGGTAATTALLSTADGTALADTHYTAVTAQLVSFAAGENTATATITLSTAAITASKTFIATLTSSGAVGAAIGSIPTVTVRIRADVTPPVVAISAPLANANLNEAAAGVTIAGTFNDPGISSIKVSINGSAPVAATIVAAKKTWSVTTTTGLQPGANTVQATATDLDGNTGTSAPVAFTYVVLRPLTVTILPTADGSTSPATPAGGTVTFSPALASGSKAQIGRTYTVTEKPGTGFYFNSWTGKTTGTAATANFIFAEGDTVTASFAGTPFTSAVAGTYNGVIQGGTGYDRQTNAGLFTATLTANTGAFTGKLILDGTTSPIAGVFDHVTKTFTSTVESNGFNYSLLLDTTGPVAKINGTITQKRRGADIAVLTLTAPQTYSTASKPDPELASVYHLAFTAPTAPATLEAGEYPTGNGYGILTIGAAGATSLTGVLADGTAYTGAAAFCKDQTVPVYGSFATRIGAIVGTAAIDPARATTDVTATGIRWFRSANLSQFYPFGYDTGLSMDLVGALRATSDLASLGLTAPQVVLSGAGFTATATQAVTAGLTGLTFNSADKTATVTFGATGLMTGTYSIGPLKYGIKGLILGKAGLGTVYGHFLTPTPLHTDGLGEGGKFLFGNP